MQKKHTGILVLSFFLVGISLVTGQQGEGMKNELIFSSTDINMEGFQLTHVEAVKHTMSTAGKTYTAMVIMLANYDRGSRSYHPNPKEEGQRRVMLSFSTPSGKDLKTGSYDINGAMAKDYRLSGGIEKQGKNIGFYNAEGTGEIIAIDSATISGKVDIRDKRGTVIKATFKTPWTKSRY